MTPDDIVKLGPQWIIQGNCFDVLPRLPAGSVDMVFADLPYGITGNKWDELLPIDLLWSHLLRIGAQRASFIFTATMPFGARLIQSQSHLFRYDLVWKKSVPTDFLNANRKPMRAHENVLVFSRATCNAASKIPMYFVAQTTPGTAYVKKGNSLGSNYNGGRGGRADTEKKGQARYPLSVLSFFRCQSRIHPTQKPVALLEWLIRTYCPEGGLVLDPTAGVATTAVAAQRTGRRSICIERDPGYHAAAVDRVRAAQATGGATAPVRPKRVPRPAPAAQRCLWAK